MCFCFVYQVQFLFAVCGENHPSSVKNIMAKLGTNELWSSYSREGGNGKWCFKDLPRLLNCATKCVFYLDVCLRAHNTANEDNIEKEIHKYLDNTERTR